MNEPTLEIVNTTASQMARVEIDAQVSTAKQYPRNIAKVKLNMLSFATLDEETAESCFYSLPRGGKNIEGPSVRLAEIAVACYGNIRAGVRILETVMGENPHVVIQAICHDLENNTAVTIEKRRRIVKKKSKTEIDEDDINLAANAGSAIAFRDAVYKIVPGALIKPVYEAAKKVAIGDAKSIGDRRNRAFDSFAKMGISKDRVLLAVNKAHIDLVDADDLQTLFGLHTSIKEGATTLDNAFPAAAAAAPTFAVPTPTNVTPMTPTPSQTPPTPAAARKKAEKAAAAPAGTPAPAPSPEPTVPAAAAPTPAPEPPPAAPDPAATTPTTEPTPGDDGLGDPLDGPVPEKSPEMQALLAAMAEKEVAPANLIRFSSARNLMKETAYGKEIETLGLADIRTDKLAPLTKNILAAGDTLKKIKAA